MTPENFKPKKDFNTRLENTKSLPDIFEVVKAAVWNAREKVVEV